MLCLDRKIGEVIHIGTDIVVSVLERHGKKIWIGIEAPKEVPVYRGEVYEEIRKQSETPLEE